MLRKLILVLLAVVCLAGCSTGDKTPATGLDQATSSNASTSSNSSIQYLGFLTTDGTGVADRPFQYDHVYDVEWDVRPYWTALPVYVVGEVEGGIITGAKAYEYKHTEGENSTVDAYYAIIEGGYQEDFETIFCEIYDKLNGAVEDSPIDGTPIQEFLSFVYDKEEYGTLRDILTDALVIVKEYNDGGDKEELNSRAYKVYNDMYSWLFSFSRDELIKS